MDTHYSIDYLRRNQFLGFTKSGVKSFRIELFYKSIERML